MRSIFASLLLGLLTFGITFPAHADIERKAVIDCKKQQICLYVWPGIPDVAGWHRDEDASYQLEAAVLIKDGKDLNSSDSVLFGSVVSKDRYKTDHPNSNAVDGFILDDADTFRKNNPGIIITELELLTTADGQKMRTFSFLKLKGGHSQMAAYGEDRDKDGAFFIVLTIDVAGEASLEHNASAFRQMVGSYKHYAGNN